MQNRNQYVARRLKLFPPSLQQPRVSSRITPPLSPASAPALSPTGSASFHQARNLTKFSSLTPSHGTKKKTKVAGDPSKKQVNFFPALVEG